MGPAAIVGLAKGESAKFADPTRPNAAYEPFVMGVLTLIGAGLGIPVELLIKKFNASYSASRAALLDAWQHFRSERAWLVLSFCQPVYETWMAEAVASRRIAAPGFFSDPLIRWAYTRAAWHGDSQGSLNPKDEVAAYRDAIDARLMTHERAEWELFGSDWTRTFPVKRRERDMLKEAEMLPEPKAGAATQRQQADQAEQRKAQAEMLTVAKTLQDSAQAIAREPVQLELSIHNEPIQVQISQDPTHVVLEQADTHVHLESAKSSATASSHGHRVIPLRDPVTGLAREYLKVPMASLAEVVKAMESIARNEETTTTL